MNTTYADYLAFLAHEDEPADGPSQLHRMLSVKLAFTPRSRLKRQALAPHVSDFEQLMAKPKGVGQPVFRHRLAVQ